jgi:hypothetical protein
VEEMEEQLIEYKQTPSKFKVSTAEIKEMIVLY